MTLLPALSNADCARECKQALDAADKVIADQQKEIDIYKGLTGDLTKEVAELDVSIKEKNQALEAWYHNPFVIGSIGIFLGGATVLFLKK